MNRITILAVGIAVLGAISAAAEAADGCGRGWFFTMGSVAHSKKDTPGRDITARESVTTSRRHRVTTSQRPGRVTMSHSRKRVTTSQNHLWPDPNYGSISAAGMSRNTRHQIRHSGRGTIAHRFTPCRTGCVSHRKDAKNGLAACTSPRRKTREPL
jgi:hypothetical protein